MRIFPKRHFIPDFLDKSELRFKYVKAQKE
jgi:hypothetical protein